jgi:hypothetical protein
MLKVVAYIEIVSGVLSAVDVVGSLLADHRLSVNFGVLGIWIGSGLLKRRESSRVWGAWFAAIGATLTTVVAMMFAAGAESVPLRIGGAERGYISHWWAVAFGLGLAALCTWEIIVLQDPDVRALFQPEASPSA